MGSQTNKRTFAMKQVLSYKNLNESGACISSSPFCLIRFSNNWKNGGGNLLGEGLPLRQECSGERR